MRRREECYYEEKMSVPQKEQQHSRKQAFSFAPELALHLKRARDGDPEFFQ